METAREVLSVPLEDIVQIENSREVYDREEMAQLMTNMKAIGLLSPIGLHKKQSGKFELVFGNRRFLAAQKLGWKKIDALLVDLDTEEDMLLTNAIENMQRSDVPPAEQGRIFVGLMKQGLTAREIAARVGVPQSRVDSLVRLFNYVPAGLRKSIAAATRGTTPPKGQMSATTASTISGIVQRQGFTKGQAQTIFESCLEEGLAAQKVRQVAALVKGGHTVKEAIKEISKTRLVTLSILLPIDHIKRLQDEHGQAINEIIYDFLADERWLKMVKAPTKGSKKRGATGNSLGA